MNKVNTAGYAPKKHYGRNTSQGKKPFENNITGIYSVVAPSFVYR
jgi:hypothetical protein